MDRQGGIDVSACSAVGARTFDPGRRVRCDKRTEHNCTTQTVDLENTQLSGGADDDKKTFRGRGRNKAGNTLAVNPGGAPAPNPIASAVPEPETYAMMLLGLGVIAWSLRRPPKG